MLAEHGQMARGYPDVRANTVSAFALGDYEWLLAFEADELHRIVDLMRHLRGSRARLHVREEVPFYTGRRKPVSELVAAAAVTRHDQCEPRVSASPHGTDGHGPETDLPQPVRVAEPPPRRRMRDRIGRRSRLIAVLLSASLVYVIVDIFVQGPLTQLDICDLVDWDGEAAFPALERAAWLVRQDGPALGAGADPARWWPASSRGGTAPGGRSFWPRCHVPRA